MTETPELRKLMVPLALWVYISKEEVGARELGLVTPPRVKYMLSVVSSVGKHPSRVRLLERSEREQDVMGKEAERREGATRVSSGGKTTRMDPPAGMKLLRAADMV